MKFLALSLALASGLAFAEVPEIVAKDVTCNQLKEQVKNYKNVVIVKKVLGFKKRFSVQDKASCSSDERTNYGVFKTKDVKK